MGRAIISVWDKTNIESCARRLAGAGLEIVSTGGTAEGLAAAGINVTQVSTVTGFPEILDGRVKTLHPAIHGGILARHDLPEHVRTLEELGIEPVHVLVSNLYPFSSVVQRESVDRETAIENIDIGGPAMLRAAAKNHASVVVLIDPADYDEVLALIERGGVESVPLSLRQRLAAKVFEHVSRYDSLVGRYLRAGDTSFAEELSVGGRLLSETKYGENPHQRGAVYAVPRIGPARGIATWSVHQNKEMSYNNYLDASAALRTVQEFEEPAIAIIKHTLPCGVGVAEQLPVAFERALAGDPVSAFGGILAANRPIDLDTVEAIGRLRLDVMIAPGYTQDAIDKLERRRNLRIATVGNMAPDDSREVRSIPGGLLFQDADLLPVTPDAWECVTDRQPTRDELSTLEFAWKVVRNVKSNAIVLASPGMVTGIGAGQPNRVESVRIAIRVAGDEASGSVLASDAFFPFADGIEAAAAAGVVAIAQPGGSVRDEECISSANAAGIAMMFTGERHFRH